MIKFLAENKLVLIFNLLAIIGFFIILKKKKIDKDSLLGILILYIVTNIQLIYISYTPYYVRQHDTRDFFNYQNGGHLGYLGYIFNNGVLPKVNPMKFWCFSNPPLFYLLSVAFMKVLTFFGTSIENCLENLQITTLIYVAIFNYTVYLILKEMNIKKLLPYVIAFVGLTPIMIILSGSIGNGTLSVALATIAIYSTIIWYESDRLLDLITIALSIGFAVMTKIDSALVSIPIAVVFLVKVIKNKKEIKKYIVHFLIFAIIALPIGLWFPVKNLIEYDVPLTYVQSVERTHESNVEEFSALERFFTIKSPNTLENINVEMAGENRDYNIFTTTVKSMIVDENVDYSESKTLDFVVHSLFYLAIIITILFIINLIYVIKNYKKINNHWLLFFIGLLVIEAISYVVFCFKYPFVFTMNFRYIIPTLISFSVISGIACENNKILLNLNRIILSLFGILSIIMFVFLR